MSTVCARCTWLIVPEGARPAYWKWLCAAKKRPKEFNPVTGNGDLHRPYQLCKDVNKTGECPDFDPGPTVIYPRADADGVAAE